jgi:hypothetical protein
LEADMTYAGTVTMSAKKLDRLEVLGRAGERRSTLRQAADLERVRQSSRGVSSQ